MERNIRARGHALRFGLVTPPMWRSWDDLLDLWTRAERAGFDMAFNTDHLVSDWQGDHGPTLEAWTMLGALAREVPRITIGTYVTGITYRNVGVLAKQALTLDHISGGRLILGLGAAWNAQEHRAYGIPFPPAPERVGRVADTLEILRHFESDDRTTYNGRYVTIDDAPFEPKPLTGHIPVLIGSQAPRMMRLAAKYADFVDFSQTNESEVRELGNRMLDGARASGRSADAVRWMHEAIAGPDPAEELEARVLALGPLGVSVFLVNIWPRADPAQVDRAGRVLDRLRRAWT